MADLRPATCSNQDFYCQPFSRRVAHERLGDLGAGRHGAPSRASKLRGAGASEAEVEKIVLDDPEIARRLEGLSIRRVIVVKDRIVNIVAA